MLLRFALAISIWSAWVVPSAMAEPLDLRDVAEGAKLVMHHDVAGGRATTKGKKLDEKFAEHALVKRFREQMRTNAGIDPRELTAVTVYAPSLDPAQSVVLVRGKYDVQVAVASLAKKRDYQSSAYGDYTLHQWTERERKQGKWANRRVVGAFHSPTRFVAAENSDALRAALDVLDGKRANAAGKINAASAGAVYVLRARDLPGAEYQGRCPVLKRCSALEYELGEKQGAGFFNTTITAISAETAGQIRDVVQGVRAFSQLASARSKCARTIATGLTVELADRVVKVQFEAKDHSPAQTP